MLFLCSNLLSGQNGFQSLEKELALLYKKSDLPGFAVAIVDENQVLFNKGFGFAEVATKSAYTSRTTQQIASVSKTTIGLALMKLLEERKLTLDTKINDILPFSVNHPKFPQTEIRIRHLANHTSGIKDLDDILLLSHVLREQPPLDLQKYPAPYDALIDQISKQQCTSLHDFLFSYLSSGGTFYQEQNFNVNVPGTHFEYSNIAAALAAYIVEIISGQSFAEYTQQSIFEPLKMQHTAWFSETLKQDDLAREYLQQGLPLPRHFNCLYPASGLMSSVDDLSAYLMALIRNHSGVNHLIKTTAFHELTKGQVDLGNQKVAHFFFIDENGNIGHNGSDVGVTTKLYFNPKSGKGAVLLANVGVENDELLTRQFIKIWEQLEREISHNYDTSIPFYQKIPVEGLKADLQLLRHNLEQVHAGLYTYTPKEKFDQLFEQLESSLTEPLTELEFYRKIGRLSKYIANQHTEIEISPACYEYVESNLGMFPFGVKYLNEELYIVKNLSGIDAISEGTRIVSINGRSVQEIFQQLRQYWSRDGKNLTSPNAQLSNTFMDYYALILGSPEHFELELKDSNEQLLKVLVPALTWTEILHYYKKRYKADYKRLMGKGRLSPLLDLKINEQIAILKLRTFHPERAADRGQEFHAFLQESFKQIREEDVKQLILDIRYNNGGSDVLVGEVLSYLLSDPFSVYKQMSTITNTIPNHENYQGDMAELEQWAQETLIPFENQYLLPNGDATQVWEPKALNYEGELYILTNARTYSAAGDFCGIIKQHQRGQFVGEEPGGNGNCNTAGLTLTLILPNSGIRAHIPTVRFELAVDFENTGHGIVPDYEVIPDIKDFLEDRDPVLDFVKGHISKTEY